MKKLIYIIACFFQLAHIYAQNAVFYKDSLQKIWVDSTYAQMNLDEKIGQLNLLTPGGGVATGAVVSKGVEEKIANGKVGGLFGVIGEAKIRQAQELAVTKSRLKIPLLFGSDVIHGYKTLMPPPPLLSPYS